MQTDFDKTVGLIKSLDEAESLVFWLGGIWDGAHMTGFSADPFLSGRRERVVMLQPWDKGLVGTTLRYWPARDAVADCRPGNS